MDRVLFKPNSSKLLRKMTKQNQCLKCNRTLKLSSNKKSSQRQLKLLRKKLTPTNKNRERHSSPPNKRRQKQKFKNKKRDRNKTRLKPRLKLTRRQNALKISKLKLFVRRTR